jgi:soluble lytic murein transglycosylase-like protein
VLIGLGFAAALTATGDTDSKQTVGADRPPAVAIGNGAENPTRTRAEGFAQALRLGMAVKTDSALDSVLREKRERTWQNLAGNPGSMRALLQASDTNGIPFPLAIAIATQESEGRATAGSAAGARGIFQVMGTTAAGLGLSRHALHDPMVNANAGLTYLGTLLRKYAGRTDAVAFALAAYNMGPGAFGRVLRRTASAAGVAEEDVRWAHVIAYRARNGLPTETALYVPRVLVLFARWNTDATVADAYTIAQLPRRVENVAG